MKTIVIFIDSEPSVGGVFQYNITMLKAVVSLPEDDYKVIIVYTRKIWENYLVDHGVKKIYISFGQIQKKLIQFLLMIGLPLKWFRTIFGCFHPVARKLIALKADLYIFPSQENFWSYLIEIPAIVSIHDLMHEYEKHFPEVYDNGRYRYKHRHFVNVCKYAKGILVDSEYGKRQVHQSYLFPKDKIYALPYIAPHYINFDQSIKELNTKYSLPPKYVFYPAQFWHHKNHSKLIFAINDLRKKIPDISLVLVGTRKNAYKAVLKLVKELDLKKNVCFMGYVSDSDMSEFYKRARAMVMPTFFGPTNIPPLEAFVCGCPVGISNIYGMPEQVGDAALLFDPNSVNEIANVIKVLWEDDELCAKLASKGRVKALNWNQASFNKRFKNIIFNFL